MNKHLTVQNIVITVLVIFFMMIGAIGTGMFKCTNSAINQEGLYKFVSKNGEGVIFIPQPKSKAKEEEVVIALVTAGEYQKVDVLPEKSESDIQCTITPIQKSFNLNVECIDPEHKFPVYKVYDPTAKSSFGFVGYVQYISLPIFIDEFRYSLRKK